MSAPLSLRHLFRNFRPQIFTTWALLAVENILVALIPLFLGHAIDGLLDGSQRALWEVAAVLGGVVVVAVGRRAYDTRAYGTMRVHFGSEVVERLGERKVSVVNARLDMSREMVDFLEGYVPALLTSVVQLAVSVIVLWGFGLWLGLSSVGVIVVLILVYSLFHARFFVLNQALNSQTEKQVDVIEERRPESLLSHLRKLRHCEVRLSDTDALLYGAIYLGMFAFILTNLWLASRIEAVTAGMIFAILSYSWELVESGTTLPMTLQQWSRLSEIQERLNEEPQASEA